MLASGVLTLNPLSRSDAGALTLNPSRSDAGALTLNPLSRFDAGALLRERDFKNLS